MRTMQIKLVLFDAAGVLFPTNRVVGEDLTAKFNLSADQQQLMWNGFYLDYSVGKLTTPQFLDTFAATYNVPREKVVPEAFTESFLKALTPMPGIEDVLAHLEKTKVTIAMLSDTSGIFSVARRELPSGKYFDHLFLSFEIGYRKPDQRAYKAVTDYYKIRPQEVFFIDDNPANVEAATQFGMQGVRFTDSQALMNNLKQAGLLP
jgi:glucose-1-phosphatase